MPGRYGDRFGGTSSSATHSRNLAQLLVSAEKPVFAGDFRVVVRLPDIWRLEIGAAEPDFRPRSPVAKFKCPEFQIGVCGDWFDSRGDRFDFVDQLGSRPPKMEGK